VAWNCRILFSSDVDGHRRRTVWTGRRHWPARNNRLDWAVGNAFHLPHSRSVKQPDHQPVLRFDIVDDPLNFIRGQDCRQGLVLLRPDILRHIVQINVYDIATQKQQRRERLILRGCRAALLHRKVGQEAFDIRLRGLAVYA